MLFKSEQQMHRLPAPFLTDYRLPFMLGGIEAYHYLQRLNLGICRFLKEEKKSIRSFKES